jgi:RNA polymerase sigma factor (sigma-70 family)
MLDEQRVVEQARKGDESAWRSLYETYADFVFRLAMRRLDSRDAALDVVQETFTRASMAIDGFRGDAAFKSWIARIAINEVTNQIRREARRKEAPLETVEGARHDEEGPDIEVARKDMAARAFAFIRGLPDQQRDALLLRTTEGLSYAEIARILDSTEGSVRVSYHHGLRKLREHFGNIAELA